MYMRRHNLSLHSEMFSSTISDMKERRQWSQRGAGTLAVIFVLTFLLLIGVTALSVWLFGQMQDYKNNVMLKVNAAVAIAKQQESDAKDAYYKQQEEFPFRTYNGPATYGSVTVEYPKSWSAYVVDDTNSSPFINAYFFPGVVPDTQSQTIAYPLRVQLVQDSYSSVLQQLSNDFDQGQTTVAPYSLPKVPSVVGSILTGKIADTKSGIMVVLPLRNMTVEIWTESSDYANVFNNNILPNASFAP